MILTCLFAACGCSIEPSAEPFSGQDRAAKGDVKTNCQTETKIEMTVLGLTQKNCLSCHGEGQTSPDLSTQSKLDSNRTEVIRSVENKSMPPGSKLSDREIDVISEWITDTSSLHFNLAEEVDYANVIRPLINSKCTFCHSANGLYPEGPYLDSFERMSSKANKSHEEMSQGEMPEDNEFVSGNSEDVSALVQWISSGKPKGVVQAYPEKVDFNKHVKPFLAKNCLSCHGQDGASPSLSNNESTKALAASIFGSVSNDSMPPGGVIFEEEKAMLQRWLNQNPKPGGSGGDGCK